MKRSDSSNEFWRCAKCGTPNPWAAYLTHCVGCGARRPEWKPEEPSPTGSLPRWRWPRSWPWPTPRPWSPRRARVGRILWVVCCAYAAALAVLVAVLAIWGDSWWPTTFILFGPRWIWTLPLPVLVPLAAGIRPRALLPLVVAVLLIVGPLLDYRVPWRAYRPKGSLGPAKLRILTCNVQGGHGDPMPLAELIAAVGPDIVLLQESQPGEWLSGVFLEPFWQRKDYPGLAMASRYPIVASELFSPRQGQGGGELAHYELSTPLGPLHVFNVHLETPREGIEAAMEGTARGFEEMRANINLRWQESAMAKQWVDEHSGPVVLAGDFNLPADSGIFRRYWSRYGNAFSEAGSGFGHTKFTRWFGIRIDHVLAGQGWRFLRARVGPDIGSDHHPVIVDLVRVKSPR